MHHRPGPCQDVSWPKVTREPPNRHPQQLRSSPCLRRGSSGSTGVPAPPKARGGREGVNCKSTGAVGLVAVCATARGRTPRWQRGNRRAPALGNVSRSKHECPRTPGTSRAAFPAPFLPPQSGAAPVLPLPRANRCPVAPPDPHQHLPHPKTSMGKTRCTIPLCWDQALRPRAIFILSGGTARSSAIQGAISHPRGGGNLSPGCHISRSPK